MVSPRPALIAVGVSCGLAIAGCNTSALTKRELVVYFRADATNAQRLAALHACGDVSPEASPEPFSTSGPVSNQVGSVRFRIDHADDKDIATVENCLDRQPGVTGVDQPDLTQ